MSCHSEAGGDLEIRAVALATGNDYVARGVGFVSEHMRDSILETRRRPNANLREIVDITIAEHEAIHAFIVARDAVLARETMEPHILNAAQRVRTSLQTCL